jgi:hypothetical protein
MATNDDDLVRKVRAGINQSKFMNPMANILVTECAIFAIIIGIVLWLWMESFWGFAIGITFIPIITGLTFFSKFDIIAYIILGLFWAAPFALLGCFISSAFFLFAVVAFIVSLVVHYWGIKFFKDLNIE